VTLSTLVKRFYFPAPGQTDAAARAEALACILLPAEEAAESRYAPYTGQLPCVVLDSPNEIRVLPEPTTHQDVDAAQDAILVSRLPSTVVIQPELDDALSHVSAQINAIALTPGPTGATGPMGPVGSVGPAGIAWRGVWNPATTYAANDAVDWQGTAYVATDNSTNSAPPSIHWSVLSAKGDTGPQGPVGASGPPGIDGAVGATGVTGPTGVQGLTGPVGPVGATGPQGIAGPVGATGPQGVAGAIGATGPAGPIGATGPQGVAGAVGATGATGVAGAVGATGPVGATGVTGAVGATGPMGATGPVAPGLITVLAAAVATSGVTETLLHRLQIPAGATVGDAYRIKLTGNSSSTGTLTFRVRVGALGTTSDAQAWISATSAAQVANARAGVELLLVVRATGATGAVMVDGVAYAGAVVLPTLIGAPATALAVITAAWWIDVTCACSTGTFTAQVASIEKVA